MPNPGFEQYSDLVIEWMEILPPSAERAQSLISAIQFGNSQWEAAVEEEFSLWQALDTAILETTPPWEFEPYHAKFSEIMGLIAEAVDDFRDGYSTNQLGPFDEGADKFNSAWELFDEMASLVPSAQGDRPGRPTIELVWMFPQAEDFDVPVIRHGTERVSDTSPSDGFVSGEKFTWRMEDPSLLHQSFLLLDVTCVMYQTWPQAGQWIQGYLERNEIILTGVTRREDIDGLAHEAHAMTGAIGSGGSVSIMALVFFRIENVACMYLGIDAQFDSTDQVLGIVTRVADRIESDLE